MVCSHVIHDAMMGEVSPSSLKASSKARREKSLAIKIRGRRSQVHQPSHDGGGRMCEVTCNSRTALVEHPAESAVSVRGPSLSHILLELSESLL